MHTAALSESPKLLVLCDIQITRLALCLHMGYEPICTSDPQEALKLVQYGRCRLVMADVHMPGMDGYQFLDQALKNDPGIHVIITTGSTRWSPPWRPCAGEPRTFKAAVTKAANNLAAQGFVVEPLQMKGLDRALDLWWFFFGPAIAHLFRPSVAGQGNQLSRIFREYLEVAEAETKVTLDAFLAACAERDVLRAEILRQMRDVPILLSPISSTTAFLHGEGTWRPGAKECYRDTMRFSQWLNLTGMPGASVPVGVSARGLPIGVQVIGRRTKKNWF